MEDRWLANPAYQWKTTYFRFFDIRLYFYHQIIIVRECVNAYTLHIRIFTHHSVVEKSTSNQATEMFLYARILQLVIHFMDDEKK